MVQTRPIEKPQKSQNYPLIPLANEDNTTRGPQYDQDWWIALAKCFANGQYFMNNFKFYKCGQNQYEKWHGCGGIVYYRYYVDNVIVQLHIHIEIDKYGRWNQKTKFVNLYYELPNGKDAIKKVSYINQYHTGSQANYICSRLITADMVKDIAIKCCNPYHA